jgi:hypothetical protein
MQLDLVCLYVIRLRIILFDGKRTLFISLYDAKYSIMITTTKNYYSMNAHDALYTGFSFVNVARIASIRSELMR